MSLNKNSTRLRAIMCSLSLTLGATHVPAVAQEQAPQPENQVNFEEDRYLPHVDVASDEVVDRLVIRFQQNMDLLTEERKMAVVDEILKEHAPDTTVEAGKYAHNGDMVVQLSKPIVGADKINALRGHLESKAEIYHADIDKFIRITPTMTHEQRQLIQSSAKMSAMAAPNDTDYPYQWYLNGPEAKGANVIKAWDLGYKGASQNIAIVDSGITDHSDLNSKVIQGADMLWDSSMSRDHDGRDNDPQDEGDWVTYNQCGQNDPADSVWHGTHVAGIAAADTNNSKGVAGVAPDAKIQPIRALGACGGYTSDIADGIAWAAGKTISPHLKGTDSPTFTYTNPNPSKVINLSLGGDGTCGTITQDAIDYANSVGAVVLIAAGNENEPSAGKSPANCKNVLTVGATGPEGYRSTFSNYDAPYATQVVDFGAPGGNMAPNGWNNEPINPEAGIYNTVNTGATVPVSESYDMMQGTSMATPLVAGVVAMMLDANPALKWNDVERILKSTAYAYETEPRYIDPDNGMERNAPYKTEGLGAGIVDAYAAVCQAMTEGGKSCTQAVTTTPATTAPATTAPATTDPATTVNTTTTFTTTVTSTSVATVTAPAQTVTATVEPAPQTTTVTETAPVETMTVGVPTTVVVTTTENGVPSTVTETTTVPSTVTAAPVTTVITEPSTVVVTTTENGVPSTITETATATNTVTAAPVTITQTDTVPTTITTTLPVVTEPAVTVTETAPVATETQVEVTTEPAVTVTQVVPTTITTTNNGTPTTVTTTAPNVEVTEVATETVTSTTTVQEAPVTVTTTPGAPAPAPGDSGSSTSGLWFLPLIFGGVFGLIAHFFAPNLFGNQDNGSSTQAGFAGIFAGLAGILARIFNVGGADGSTQLG